MNEYEECRTYPASVDHPIWGRRKGDRFHPWFVPSLEANWIGYPLSQCGPNVSPDGSVLIEKEVVDYGNISPGTATVDRRISRQDCPKYEGNFGQNCGGGRVTEEEFEEIIKPLQEELAKKLAETLDCLVKGIQVMDGIHE